MMFWGRASPQAPRCAPVPGSPALARARVSIPLIYCCRANAYRVLLAEKSSGEVQRARRGKEGIAQKLERAGDTQSSHSPARGHAQPVGRGLRRARSWGGLDLLCIIAPNTWGLGGS